jgi:hypothetical protein
LCWPKYAERQETRHEHLIEVRTSLGLSPFGVGHYRQVVHMLTDQALQTDKGVVLAASALGVLRRGHVIVPTLDMIERIYAEAVTRANRRISKAYQDESFDIRNALDWAP